MAIHVLTPPTESLDALRPVLGPARSQHAHPQLAFVANAAPSEVTVPTPVYSLGLDALAQQGGLSDAKHVAWRYIIDKGTGRRVAAEVSYDDATAQHAFASLNEGSFVDDTPVQLSAAETSAEAAAGDFELRLLRVPALYFVALWLHGRNGAQDLLVPLQPAQAPFVAGQLYPADQVEPELRKQAAARASFDDRPKP